MAQEGHAWKIPLGEYPELAAKGLKDTGSENATAASYEVDGRQYIVIAASGGGVVHNERNTRGTRQGATYVAFALPSGTK